MANYFKINKPKISKSQFAGLGLQIKNIKPRDSINEFSKNIFSDKLVLTFLVAWFFPIVFALIFILLNLKSLPLEIPLYYSLTFGDGQLAGRNMIIIPLIGAFILGTISFLMVNKIIKESKILAYIIAGSAPLVAISAVITTMKIVALVK